MAELQVTDAYSVSDRILAIRVETGEITRGTQQPYSFKPGDAIESTASGQDPADPNDTTKVVYRNNEQFGLLVGDGTIVRTFDEFSGDKLDEDWVRNSANYSVNGVRPKNIFTKNKIANSALVGNFQYEFAEENTIFLELSEPMQVGQRYEIEFRGDELADTDFVFEPERDRSESVHVSHLGFHPDDPSKVAFLSTWMGPEGGGLSYEEGQSFSLINADGQTVYSGEIALAKRAGELEDFPSLLAGFNYNGTDVYIADFSNFSQAGEYRVAVDDVGTSFPFIIGENTWSSVFQTSMEGLYAQRSGTAIEPAFSDYTAPRSFFPGDGVEVFQTNISYLDAGEEAFEEIVENGTDQVLEDAWGGWKDAGDWDRNTRHVKASRELLELYEMFPAYFSSQNLTIPESGNNIADVVDEALWGVDFFKRLQREDGGVRGGIESSSFPKAGEASWQESRTVYAYAPDAWASYGYAAIAAKAAYLIQDIDPARAQEYEDTAIKAMNWATAEQRSNPRDDWRIDNEKNLAALELYRLTGDEQWHELFLSETLLKDAKSDAFVRDNVFNFGSYDQRDAAFLYAQLDMPDADQTVQANARTVIKRAGDRALEAIDDTGFKWYKDPGAGFGTGFSAGFADRSELARAHYLTGDQQYLEGTVIASQFMGGANPDNISYTTGIGPRQPDRTFHSDSLVLGEDAPKGLSLYGPINLELYGDNSRAQATVPFSLSAIREDTSTPLEAWPAAEAFFDHEQLFPLTEFTVESTLSPNAYAWGYIAANHASGIPATANLLSEPGSDIVRYEAESLTRTDYPIDNDPVAEASAGQFINLSRSRTGSGKATGTFDGEAGTYKVSVGYFDETDGQSPASVTVAGETTNFAFDELLSGGLPRPENKVERVTHESIQINPGDPFEIAASVDQTEFGRFDYILFEPIGMSSDQTAGLNDGMMRDLSVEVAESGSPFQQTSASI